MCLFLVVSKQINQVRDISLESLCAVEKVTLPKIKR